MYMVNGKLFLAYKSIKCYLKAPVCSAWMQLTSMTLPVHFPAQTGLSCLRTDIKDSGLSAAPDVLSGIIFYIIPPLDLIL